jgi:L-ascorbate metabolism protein UlaG (beta-lactamase superfamily)
VTAPFNGRRFLNASLDANHSLWDVARWMITSRRRPWPRWVDDLPQPSPPKPLAPAPLALTFINHSTFLLAMNGVHILTDPMYSERASPLSWFGPRRVRRPGLAFDCLPPIDLVLVSHNHYDHLDLPTLRSLRKKSQPLILTGLGNRRYLKRRGLDRVEELDWWQSFSFGQVKVTMTPAQHFSARGLFDRDRTLWGGFVLEGAGQTVYFAADTAYCEHFQQVRARWGSVDVALLPVGAYEPRWFMKEAHMDPAEAVQAHLDLTARLSIAMHFGTFQLTDEGIDEPVQRLRESLARHGVEAGCFRIPAFGETFLVPIAER